MFEKDSCFFMLELLVGQMASVLPGHLSWLVAHGSAEAGSRLLSALTELVNVMLRGEVPQFVVPVLCGVSECVIRKKKWWHTANCCWNSGAAQLKYSEELCIL